MMKVDLDSLSYEEIEELFGRTPPKIVPLTDAELASLPCHVITTANGMDTEGEECECSICLQVTQTESENCVVVIIDS